MAVTRRDRFAICQQSSRKTIRRSRPVHRGELRRRRATLKKNGRWDEGKGEREREKEGQRKRMVIGHSRKSAIDLLQKEVARGKVDYFSMNRPRDRKGGGNETPGWKNGIFPWEKWNFERNPKRTFSRCKVPGRHTCLSHPPLILQRRLRYLSE